MKRIPIPHCSICIGGTARYESELWPELQLCAPCMLGFKDWCLRSGLASGNPFFFDICIGDSTDQHIKLHDGTTQCITWGYSKYDDRVGVSSQHYLELPKDTGRSS